MAELRAALHADAARLAAMHRASILAGCAHHYSPQQLADWTAGVTATAYERLIETLSVVVAEDGVEPVGVGVGDPAAGLVNAVYVHPAAVRRGVGTALVAELESRLRAAGVPAARLHASLNAVPFYVSLGYRDEGPVISRLPSGVELPSVAMTKPLAD